MINPDHITIIVYYAIIILLIAHFRKKFEFHAWIKFLGIKFPLVAQLKTKLGLNLMKKIGERHSALVRFLADIGTGVGYIGMIAVVGFIIFGVYQLFADPSAPAALTPVIPGATIGGFTFPFWHTLIALFIVVVIHEFSHGVVSKAYKIPVKSSGYAQVGPFSAAFVEPEEKMLQKQKGRVQNAIFAAGPWSNFLTAIVVLILTLFVLNPISISMSAGSAISFENVVEGSPAEAAGLQPDTLYVRANNQTNLSLAGLITLLDSSDPGDSVEFESEQGQTNTVVLGEKDGTSYVGIEGIAPEPIPGTNPIIFGIWQWIVQLFNWVFILSLGLGLGNLIPAGPLDGGRMFLIASQKIFGKKRGELVWGRVAIFLFAIIIILFLVPIIRDMLPWLKSVLGL